MLETLTSRLQTLVPFWGDAGREVVPIRTLRLAFVLLAVLNPVYGVVYGVASPDAIDPWTARLAFVVLSCIGLVASYRVRAVQHHPRTVLAGVVIVALLWYGALASVNGLAANYAIGYLFVDLAAAMVFSLAWERPHPLAGLMGVALGIGLTVTVTADPDVSAMHPLVFATVLFTGSFVVFFALQGRLQMAGALRASEARLVKAEHLACTGAWTLDLHDGRRTWSGGAYDVLGVPRSVAPPPSQFDLVHPEDLDVCRAEFARLASGGAASDFRYRCVRPDGEVRWLHAITEVECDADGRPRSLTGAFVDVTDQMARECALARARDQAEAANRATSEFLANMSHEIRTPLTAIIGFAQLLRDEAGDAHAVFVDPIESAGRRLLGTLNSVLDLARLEADQTDLVLAPTDLAAETAEVVGMLQPQAEAKGLTLRYDGPTIPLQALADPDAFGRVVTNLVSNAVKFTDRGHVAVRLAADEGRAVLTVEDSGRGMDAAFLDELFQPFRQASTGWARSHEGTGLGLTITRRLAEAMGGAVRVESRPGEGSRFTVALPLLAGARSVRVSAREPAAA